MNTDKRPVLCTTLYRKPSNQATLMAFYINFATEVFHTVFTRKSVLKGTLRRDQKVIFIKKSNFQPKNDHLPRVCERIHIAHLIRDGHQQTHGLNSNSMMSGGIFFFTRRTVTVKGLAPACMQTNGSKTDKPRQARQASSGIPLDLLVHVNQ